MLASLTMKTPWVGALRLLLLPGIALPGLAHADEPAPPNPPPAPVAYAPAEQLAAEAKQEEPTISHIGLDGILSGGLGNFAGASMRFEVRPGTSASFLARVGYLRGAVIDDESFQAGTFSLGYRGFLSRRTYVGAEGLLMAYDEEGEDWRGVVGFTSSVGVKLGAVDASVQIMYPLPSLGINVGADFATF
jgi:hypothetical protein